MALLAITPTRAGWPPSPGPAQYPVSLSAGLVALLAAQVSVPTHFGRPRCARETAPPTARLSSCQSTLALAVSLEQKPHPPPRAPSRRAGGRERPAPQAPCLQPSCTGTAGSCTKKYAPAANVQRQGASVFEAVIWPDVVLFCWSICGCQRGLAVFVALERLPHPPGLSCRCQRTPAVFVALEKLPRPPAPEAMAKPQGGRVGETSRWSAPVAAKVLWQGQAITLALRALAGMCHRARSCAARERLLAALVAPLLGRM